MRKVTLGRNFTTQPFKHNFIKIIIYIHYFVYVLY